MKGFIDLSQIRVVQADNYKGNPRIYLEVADQRILYSDPYTLARSERWKYNVTEDEFGRPVVDTEMMENIFRARLGHMLAKALLRDDPDLAEVWSDDTDRDIDYTPPRFSQEDE